MYKWNARIAERLCCCLRGFRKSIENRNNIAIAVKEDTNTKPTTNTKNYPDPSSNDPEIP